MYDFRRARVLTAAYFWHWYHVATAFQCSHDSSSSCADERHLECAFNSLCARDERVRVCVSLTSRVSLVLFFFSPVGSGASAICLFFSCQSRPPLGDCCGISPVSLLEYASSREPGSRTEQSIWRHPDSIRASTRTPSELVLSL